MKNILLLLLVLIQYGYANDIYYYQNNKKVILTPNDSLSRSVSNLDYYTNANGLLLGVSDKLLVKFHDSVPLESILTPFNLSLVKTLAKNLYLLQAPNKSLTLSIANQLTQTPENLLSTSTGKGIKVPIIDDSLDGRNDFDGYGKINLAKIMAN